MPKPIRKSYSHAKANEAKRQRHAGAEQRQEAHANRTEEQQLAKLDAGGYKATKERARLQSRIDRKKKNKT